MKNENAKLKKKMQKLTNKLAKGETDASPSKEPSVETDQMGWLKDVYLRPSSCESPKCIRGMSRNPNAFCVLVMNRDAYAIGAAVLAHRLKKLNTKADIVR